MEMLESKATKIAGETLESVEMEKLKKEVRKNPEVLEKMGRDPSEFIKNLEGVSVEKPFNTENCLVCWNRFWVL